MTLEQLEQHLRTVLTELLPDIPADSWQRGEVLAKAGKIVSSRYDTHHRALHADAQRGGAIVWAMRQRKISWREIYDRTGIVQRTGARWMALFEAEGITEQDSAELRARADGTDRP
jgi:hypothetical protein